MGIVSRGATTGAPSSMDDLTLPRVKHAYWGLAERGGQADHGLQRMNIDQHREYPNDVGATHLVGLTFLLSEHPSAFWAIYNREGYVLRTKDCEV